MSTIYARFSIEYTDYILPMDDALTVLKLMMQAKKSSYVSGSSTRKIEEISDKEFNLSLLSETKYKELLANSVIHQDETKEE